VVGAAVADLRGNAEVARERVDLRLVEVRDGLHVGGAVAVLHEEALVVLEAVGRADHGVVEAVGVEVLDGLAHALLEAGGRHHLQVLAQRHARLAASPSGGLTTSLK
jgi:hypothetical protein